jgi:hypothetical protein
MSVVVGCILKAYGNSKESSARTVGVRSIIGYKGNGNGNVRNAGFEPHFVAEV